MLLLTIVCFIAEKDACSSKPGHNTLCDSLGVTTKKECLENGYACCVWSSETRHIIDGDQIVYSIATIKLPNATSTMEEYCCQMIRDVNADGHAVFWRFPKA